MKRHILTILVRKLSLTSFYSCFIIITPLSILFFNKCGGISFINTFPTDFQMLFKQTTQMVYDSQIILTIFFFLGIKKENGARNNPFSFKRSWNDRNNANKQRNKTKQKEMSKPTYSWFGRKKNSGGGFLEKCCRQLVNICSKRI